MELRITDSMSPRDLWRGIARRTRLEPVAQLVLVGALLEQRRILEEEGGNEEVAVGFGGPDAFRRLVQKTCPWMAELRWRMPAPDERVDVSVDPGWDADPGELAAAFLHIYGRSFLKKSAIRPELVDALITWLELEEGAKGRTWITGEDRGFVAAFGRAVRSGAARFATPSSLYAQAFLALRAYGYDVEVTLLKPGQLDLSELDGPVLTLPEPNVETGRAPLGIFSLDEYNYANAALANEHRIAAIVSGGMLFRSQGDDADIKRRFLRSNRLACAVSVPPATGVVAGIETIGALLCLERSAAGKAPLVTLMSFPRLANSRNIWPAKLAAAFDRALLTGECAEGIEAATATAEALLEDRTILTAGNRMMGEDDLAIESLIEERGSRALSTFVTVIRCHAMGITGREASGEGETIREATPNDISECGILLRPQKAVELDPKDRTQMRRLTRQLIRKGDILFTQRGRIGSIALIDEVPEDERWTAGQLFLILRMREDSPVQSPDYVMRYLQSAPVKKRMQRLSSNTSVPQIRAEDLENLQVPLPDPLRGVEGCAAAMARIRRLAAEIERLRERAKAEMDALEL